MTLSSPSPYTIILNLVSGASKSNFGRSSMALAPFIDFFHFIYIQNRW